MFKNYWNIREYSKWTAKWITRLPKIVSVQEVSNE